MAVRNKQVEVKDSVGYLVRKDYVLTKRCTSPSTTSVTAAVEDKAIQSVVSGQRVAATGFRGGAGPGRLDETAGLPIYDRATIMCFFLFGLLFATGLKTVDIQDKTTIMLSTIHRKK